MRYRLLPRLRRSAAQKGPHAQPSARALWRWVRPKVFILTSTRRLISFSLPLSDEDKVQDVVPEPPKVEEKQPAAADASSQKEAPGTSITAVTTIANLQQEADDDAQSGSAAYDDDGDEEQDPMELRILSRPPNSRSNERLLPMPATPDTTPPPPPELSSVASSPQLHKPLPSSASPPNASPSGQLSSDDDDGTASGSDRTITPPDPRNCKRSLWHTEKVTFHRYRTCFFFFACTSCASDLDWQGTEVTRWLTAQGAPLSAYSKTFSEQVRGAVQSTSGMIASVVQ